MITQLEFLAELLAYPSSGYVDRARECRRMLTEVSGAAASELEAFVTRIEGQTLEELQETYVTAFDLNPKCALEVGWHLYGEDYQRGEFLVQVRRMLREHGIVETAELPDHLGHILKLLARLERREAGELVSARVMPAVENMAAALEDSESPFRYPVNAARVLLLETFGQRETQGASQTLEAGR